MNTTEELAKARAELASAQERLAKLEAQAKEDAAKAAAPWEPKGGRFYLDVAGFARGDVDSDVQCRIAGSEYPTREAAESALPYVTFFKRLCCLAAELNPSGKVGGKWWLMNAENEWRKSFATPENRDPLCIFETEEAAQKAADILQRDGWRVPAL